MADAGWNEVFRPEPDPNAPFGHAWNIAGWNPASPPPATRRAGFPEVVFHPPAPPVDWACLPIDEGKVSS